MIRVRDYEAEEYMKRTSGSNACFIRGNNGIVKDTVNKKLYHFFGKTDTFIKTPLGLHFSREN